MLDAQLLMDEPPYDIVFCRNMLIYFDRMARDRTFSFLNRVLRPDGLLFIGYAETGLIDVEQYQPVPYPQTFTFYKRSSLSPARCSNESEEQGRDRLEADLEKVHAKTKRSIL
ncbi:MAG: CheR family methyltransferase [Phormidesmis sp.]